MPEAPPAGVQEATPHEAREVPPAELFGRTVTRVTISGLDKIEETTVRGTLRTKAGAPLDAAAVRRDIEEVFALGFFQDVVVEGEPDGESGVAVTVRVTELPPLSTLTFEGNKKMLTETLKETASGLQEGGFLVPGQVARTRRAILEKYDEDGYRRATVVPVQRLTRDPLTGRATADLAFVIDEGKKTKVRKIRFSGNTAFSDRVLRKRLKTRERFWLTSWLTDSGLYKSSQVDEDLLRLEDFYQDNGYLEVEVGQPEVALSEDKLWYTLTYPVTEGPLYTVGDIQYRHAGLVPDAELTANLSVRPGDTYSRHQLRADVSTLVDRLGSHGYAFAQVNPQLEPHPETGRLDITFDIKEGDLVRIHHINISGNTKTRDNVIRREVRQQEGEIIDTSLLRRSFQRINNLNYFENIDINLLDAGPGLLDLDVRVQEKSTGQFSIGGGYSSVDGLVGLAEITQGNLGGRGQTLSGRIERSGRRTVYNLRFRNPYLWDSPYSGGFDLFRTQRDFDSYKERRSGGGVTFGRAVGEYVNLSLSYTLERLDVRQGNPAVSPPTTIEFGRSSSSSVALSVSRDARDSFLDPRKGTRNVLRMEVAGGYLGASNQFVKGTWDSSVYFPLPKASALSFRSLLGLASGYSGENLPAGERFFVGGEHTMRGFGFGEAGPLDYDRVTDTGTGDPLGGYKEWVVTSELIFPLVKAANLKGVIFMDWGAGFDKGDRIDPSNMNRSWGYEIRWISPLGPLRYGFGWVVNDQRPPKFQRNGQVLFTIGTFF